MRWEGGVRQTLTNNSKKGKSLIEKTRNADEGGGGQIDEKSTYVIVERPLKHLFVIVLNFSVCMFE